MDILLERVTLSQERLRQVLQEGTPEEGIIMGDDGFMCVTEPKGLPVRQDVEMENIILMILTQCTPRLMCALLHLFLTKNLKS